MARNFATKEGAKVQAYCMYVKLLQRTFGGKVPPAAADAFNQCFPIKKDMGEGGDCL
ncbi:MAG: hypothetical protein LUD69_05585 [Oscillospiraceae bacterium]|nr:hypothetical protein [Oscillospiraceae bacterium]